MSLAERGIALAKISPASLIFKFFDNVSRHVDTGHVPDVLFFRTFKPSNH